jgi:transferase CAF17, mitochondrial
MLTTCLALVRFTGPKASRFLHSLLTNNILTAFDVVPQWYRPTSKTSHFLYDLFLYCLPPRS